MFVGSLPGYSPASFIGCIKGLHVMDNHDIHYQPLVNKKGRVLDNCRGTESCSMASCSAESWTVHMGVMAKQKDRWIHWTMGSTKSILLQIKLFWRVVQKGTLESLEILTKCQIFPFFFYFSLTSLTVDWNWMAIWQEKLQPSWKMWQVNRRDGEDRFMAEMWVLDIDWFPHCSISNSKRARELLWHIFKTKILFA